MRRRRTRFADAVAIELVVSPDGGLITALVAADVVAVDRYDSSESLDWLRDSFLPRCPASALVVLAGRRPPSVSWLAG